MQGPVCSTRRRRPSTSEAQQVVDNNPDAYVVIDYPDTFAKFGASLVRTGRVPTRPNSSSLMRSPSRQCPAISRRRPLARALAAPPEAVRTVSTQETLTRSSIISGRRPAGPNISRSTPIASTRRRSSFSLHNREREFGGPGPPSRVRFTTLPSRARPNSTADQSWRRAEGGLQGGQAIDYVGVAASPLNSPPTATRRSAASTFTRVQRRQAERDQADRRLEVTGGLGAASSAPTRALERRLDDIPPAAWLAAVLIAAVLPDEASRAGRFARLVRRP